MNTNQKTARTAGALYLVYIIVFIFASQLRSGLILENDAVATIRNLAASPWQLWISFVIDLVSCLLFLLTAWALYRVLKPVNPDIALLFLLLNAAGVAIQCLNDLNLLAALYLSRGADFPGFFQPEQLQSLSMLFLHLYNDGFWICQIFYGAWLFPLGYLIFKSGFLPRALGIVFMVHCVFWLTTFLQYFLFPGFDAITKISYPLGFLAEFGLSMWLIVFGTRQQKPASIQAV